MTRDTHARELGADELTLRVDPAQLGFDSTAELEPIEEIIGQPRAMRSLDLGLGVRHRGYNIYVAGLDGTGKLETIRRELGRRGRNEPRPADWVYVNNFARTDRPLAISLPAGQGRQLKQDVHQLLERLLDELPQAFRREDFSREKRQIGEDFRERRRNLFEQVDAMAKEKSLTLQQLPNGQIVLLPLKDERPMTPEELEKLSAEEGEDVRRRQREVAQQAEEIMAKQEEITRELNSKVRDVERDLAARYIAPLIDELARKYDSEKLRGWLSAMKDDMIEHLERLREPEEGSQQQQMAAMFGVSRTPSTEERLREYQVNLIVDNSEVSGAPVIIENTPTFRNLFGTIERVVDRSGKLVTDFTQIKAGSLLRASGGYLVFNMLDMLTEPLVWKQLKRVIKSGQLAIETYDPFAIFSASGVEPEPIPLDVKLVVIGESLVYHLMHLHDEDFHQIFKIKAEFVHEMDRDQESARRLGRQLRKLSEDESLPPFGSDAVAELVELGARFADDRGKVTAQFSRIADIAREAAFWAAKANGDGGKPERIGARDVRQAVEERVFRSDWIARKIRELIEQGILQVSLDGRVVGQMNGLAVADLGDYAFGRPVRVTASEGVGTAGVINIERESKLSGRTYDKGMLIIEGYLRNQYAGRQPLALSASIAMEQSYGMIDGDSASVAELLCLLGILARVPLRQDIAVTGSVDQWGNVQAIGGVNEKVEGFYDVCRAVGRLTGKQGVCVPAANVRHLVLRPDVIEAIRRGEFHVWSIDHIDQGLELLGGVEAGRPEEGESFHGRVSRRLGELAQRIKDQRGAAAERGAPVLEATGDGPRDPRPTLPGRN